VCKLLKGEDEKSDPSALCPANNSQIGALEYKRVRPKKNPSAPDGRSGCTSLSDAQGGAPTPLFFVSVASKGLRSAVSLLFATLAGRSISVAVKGLTRTKCWRESNCVGGEDFGGVRRTIWPIEALGKRASMVRRAPSFPTGPESAIPTRSGSTIAKATAGRRRDCADYTNNYSILVQLVKAYL